MITVKIICKQYISTLIPSIYVTNYQHKPKIPKRIFCSNCITCHVNSLEYHHHLREKSVSNVDMILTNIARHEKQRFESLHNTDKEFCVIIAL